MNRRKFSYQLKIIHLCSYSHFSEEEIAVSETDTQRKIFHTVISAKMMISAIWYRTIFGGTQPRRNRRRVYRSGKLRFQEGYEDLIFQLQGTVQTRMK